MAEEHTNRRLAAVLASDVVGFSRMMGADETGTLTALKRHREDVFDPAVARHHGRVVKLIGDGTLVEFTSVVDAVECALAIQRAVRSQAPATNGDGIILRIGINLGDVIIEGDDIYGDGVNVAARLEPLAEPGGVCIASIVNESIGNRIEVTFKDGGEVSVKNIARPIRVWKWHPDHDPKPVARGPAAASAPAKAIRETPSIAVLPFDNMSRDPEQEYFSDGITEDIITDLSKVGGLTVIARNSSFAYKGKSVDIRTVGRELGVKSVLEGSIRRAGNRVRITAQLIDAADGSHIWAERYDRDLTDIFAVQDEVTHEIVKALKVKLTADEAARIAEAGTKNLEAMELAMKARALVTAGSNNAETNAKAIALFDKAVTLDPRFAQAYAGLSMAHLIAVRNRWGGNPAAAQQRAEELAKKAMTADPNDPIGYVAAGWAASNRRDFGMAKMAIAKALKLDPNSAFALNARGTQTLYQGHAEEAIPDIEAAMRLDPAFSQQPLHFLGLAHLLLGHYETAATIFRERIVLAPNTDSSRCMLASALGHLGQAEQARAVWAEMMKINPQYSFAEHVQQLPFSNPADPDKIAEGLAKAGIAY